MALICLLLIFSCEKMKIYNCDNCLDEMPYEVKLKIRLIPIFSFSEEGYYVRVYKGKIEDNILIDERTAWKEFDIYGLVNQEYSAISTQTVDGIEYNIVSSTTIKVESRDDYCEEVCYIVINDNIDLRKRFQ